MTGPWIPAAGLDLAVIVPIYNEEAMLLAMAEQMAPHLDAVSGAGRWQFVLVDNGSTDGSADACDRIVQRWPTSVVVRLDRPDYGEALFAGLMRAEAPWAYIINVDFWDAAFLEWCFTTRGVYDLVMGSKRADATLNQQHYYRRLLSWGLNTLLQTVFGFVGSDTHGQKFLYLPALRPIFRETVMRRGQFDTEFTLRALRGELWLAEVPVPIVEIRAPRNFMIQKIVRNFWDIFRLFRIMKRVRAGVQRYHRWARSDIEAADPRTTALLVEMRRAHHARQTDLEQLAPAHQAEAVEQPS